MSSAKLSNTMRLKKWIGFVGLLSILALGLTLYKLALHPSEQVISSYTREPPKLNEEYTIISDSEIMPAVLPESTVSVMEFFSYHCHACYEIESSVAAWVRLQPSFVRFEQVPIAEDNSYSEAIIRLHYFVHQLRGNMTATLFQWLSEGKDIASAEVVRESLLEIGVPLKDYEHTVHRQAGFDAQIVRGKNLEKFYKIDEMPVFIIGGRYKTSPIMTNNDLSRFFEVMDALIEKVKQGKH